MLHERKWVEVNCRVNYPIKHILCSMTNNELLNMDDQCTKYCVSSMMRKLCTVGLENLIFAWNSHTILGKGIPDVLFMNNLRVARLNHDLLPTSDGIYRSWWDPYLSHMRHYFTVLCMDIRTYLRVLSYLLHTHYQQTELRSK